MDINEIIGAESFGGFVQQLKNYNLTNMDGQAFRSGYAAYFKDGVLLSFNYLDSACIHILRDPTATCRHGCQDSCAHGNAFPKAVGSEWILVWSQTNGWIKRGPWENIINKVLWHCCRVLEKRKEEVKHKYYLREKEKLDERRRKERELHEKWSYYLNYQRKS